MSLDIYLCGPSAERPVLFGANYTRRSGTMALAAGLYAAVWRPDENGITTAAQLIKPLRAGIAAMEADPARFGWRSHSTFLPWCKEYLAACEANPTATVEVSR